MTGIVRGTAPVLALDIGGTKLAAGVVDADGRVHSFAVEPTRAKEGPERGLQRLFELGNRVLVDASIEGRELGGVGIGCGGPLDPARGLLLTPLHLPDVPVAELAEQAFGVQAALENDGTAAALGEHRWGAGRGTRDMVYLTISTGVGGGVIAHGELYVGAEGNGSELGHVTVDWRGRLCRGCGRRGCLEAYVSGTSIAERAQEAGLDETAAEAVAAAAQLGDPVASAVWEETVEALASGLTSIVNVFEPQLVVIGGGVSRSGEQLLGPVRASVHEQAITPAGRSAGIVTSALGERVGVVGAAAIVYDRVVSRGVAADG